MERRRKSAYLRAPFNVVKGEWDYANACIQFGTLFVIKHVVYIGLDYDENALITARGLNQFQEPLDNNASIKDKSRWEQAGEEVVERISLSN